MTRKTLLKATLKALLDQQKIAQHIRERFILTDNRMDVVRVSEVGTYVAEATLQELSRSFYQRLVTVAASCGWKRLVKRGNVRHFRNMRRV